MTYRRLIVVCLLLIALVAFGASPAFAAAEIELYRNWDDQEVPHGSSFTFPNIDPGIAHSRLFRIENPGSSTLTISNPSSLVSGTCFSLIQNPASNVAPGGSTSFRVRFLCTTGRQLGQISIQNSSATSPYVVHLAGDAGSYPPPAQSLFTLSSVEESLWTPPAWMNYQPAPTCSVDGQWNGYEGPTARYVWRSFCLGQHSPADVLDPTSGSSSWTDPDGSGSQNHGVLWYGVSALGHAFDGDVATYDLAASKALEVLALDLQPTGQGHMRHEALGSYSGYWEGGVAAMALAGYYAPQGATKGTELLATARSWWRDHVAALRKLRLPDGQVALVGARIGGGPGYVDDNGALSAAVNLQLVDPISYSSLHPWIQALLTSAGQPAAGGNGITKLDWRRPRQSHERWLVLRAVQVGALPAVPGSHPVPCVAHPTSIYRWSESGRTQTGLTSIYGYPDHRWRLSWGPVSPWPDNVLRVEQGTSGAGGGKGPHTDSPAVQPPGGAQLLVPACQ